MLIASMAPSIALAETVNVKYPSLVDVKPFDCEPISRSRWANRVCHDDTAQYMIIHRQGVAHADGTIDAGTVSRPMGAESMGRYAIAGIKGRFDRRTHRVRACKQ